MKKKQFLPSQREYLLVFSCLFICTHLIFFLIQHPDLPCSSQAASHSCGLPWRDSGHIRPIITGPAASLPAWGDAQQKSLYSFHCYVWAWWPDDVFLAPPGRHRSPSVGGVFFCGVHVLLRWKAEVVGRPFRQPGVRVSRPYSRDPRFHRQQVLLAFLLWCVPLVRLCLNLSVDAVQGGVCGSDGIRRQPSQGVLPSETWSIKREKKILLMIQPENSVFLRFYKCPQEIPKMEMHFQNLDRKQQRIKAYEFKLRACLDES